MTARPEASSQLPPGLSPAEEAQWWDEHRQYWETVGNEDERRDPGGVRRTTEVRLRLPTELLRALERDAALLGVAECGRVGRVGHTEHAVGFDRMFGGELSPERAASAVDAGAPDARVRSREVH